LMVSFFVTGRICSFIREKIRNPRSEIVTSPTGTNIKAQGQRALASATLGNATNNDPTLKGSH